MSGSFGKPNATGRSSGKHSGRKRKIYSPPRGEPWAWLTAELLASPAWRLRSINSVRLMEFLLLDHMSHAGTENGELKAPYDQLVTHGLTRSEISRAIQECQFLGLIRYERGGRWAGTNKPSTFRLTFYADNFGNSPTNEWKGKTVEAIHEWRRDKRRLEKQKADAGSRTNLMRVPELVIDNSEVA